MNNLNDARIAKLEAELLQASAELKEAANIINAHYPRVAELFERASTRSYQVARGPAKTD